MKKKTRECDVRGCRKRKGVEAIELRVHGHLWKSYYRAELCPYHYSEFMDYITGMFK